MEIKRKIFKEIIFRLFIILIASLLAKLLYPIWIDYISENFNWIALVLLFSSVIFVVLKYFFLGFYLLLKKYLLNENIDKNNRLISIVFIIIGIGIYTILVIKGIKSFGFLYTVLILIGCESIKFLFEELNESVEDINEELE